MRYGVKYAVLENRQLVNKFSEMYFDETREDELHRLAKEALTFLEGRLSNDIKIISITPLD